MKHMAGVSDVNAVGRKEDKTNDQSAKMCFSCGKAGHFSQDTCCDNMRDIMLQHCCVRVRAHK